MGLFSSKPAPELPSHDSIVVPSDVRAALPDPGTILLSLYPSEEAQAVVAAELDRVRFPDGGYDTRNSSYSTKHAGPLGLLSWITTLDDVALQVWASQDLSRAHKRVLDAPIATLNRDRGTPYAAAWSQLVRHEAGARPQSWSLLAGLLNRGYEEWAGKITNGMVIDSIRKWQR